ncbi:hypothetical protein [Neorhizobium sp. NCHU2750]|uniref:hypothetical protein n=1 Tax=Neorhizobium sp. NCHU2750 TaxID=1825976 RepID=UPI000E745F71|nr:hypothetical protein NCHU2750_20400 [Neorhizobium sp. NCHU2750]
MNRHILAAAGMVVLIAAGSGAAHADDLPLIWQPIKNSDTSYAVKLGMRLPMRLEPEAGFDLGVDASKTGEVVDTPLKFWSKIKTADTNRPAYQMSRDIGLDLDSLADTASISMNYYEKQIATPTYNVERQSSYTLRYDGVQGDWAGIDASQSIRLGRADTGTAFIASANSVNSFDSFGASVGIEQQLGKNITLTGNLNRSFSDADTIASVNANYSYRW